MKFLIILTFVVTVRSDEFFWYPINKFFDDINNKTQEIQNFIKNKTKVSINPFPEEPELNDDILTAENKIIQEKITTLKYNTEFNNDDTLNFLEEKKRKLQEYLKEYEENKKTDEKWNVFAMFEQKDKVTPEIDLSTPGMVVANGYPCESHTIITEDGYILTVHRIPRSPNSIRNKVSRTVLLQHGIFASSADWVFAGPPRSLAYLLADAGYDVWMSNARGNRYSREHAFLKTDSSSFWDFSWHEIATRDLPAVIDYIHQTKGTGTQINYVGHSMGTTLLFALLSAKPEYNQRLHAGFALAPVVFTTHVRGPARGFAPYFNNLNYVNMILGRKEFLPKQPGHGWLGSDSCDTQHLDGDTCKNFIFMLTGFDEEQLDREMLPVFLAHIGSGTSVKTVVHFSQELSSDGRFQYFDYGNFDNLKTYGNSSPPEYALDNITLPISLFASKNDFLSSGSDVERLYASLKHPKELYFVPFEKFNHLDYLWAKDVKVLLYNKLFEILARWNP